MPIILQSFVKINNTLALYPDLKLTDISVNTKINSRYYKLKLTLYDDIKQENIFINIDFDTSTMCKYVQNCGLYDIIIKHSQSKEIVAINEDSNFEKEQQILKKIHKNKHVFIESILFSKECNYSNNDNLESVIKVEIIFENKEILEIYLGYQEEYYGECHHSLPVVTSLITNKETLIYTTSI